MTFARSFYALMKDPVTVEPYASVEGYGGKAYGPAKIARCRIEQGTRLVRDQAGKEVISQTRLFVRPTWPDGSQVSIDVKDRVTLPAGYSPQSPPIISVERHNDEGGAPGGLHHWQVNL